MSRRTGLNSERVGRDNLSTVLREVHRRGAVSRSELAEHTGLYRQTIRSLVGQLAARGLVTEEPMAPEGAPGRPSFVVLPSSATVRVLAIDIEVDSVAVAIVGLGGERLKSMRISRPRDMVAVEGTIAEVVIACQQLLEGEDVSRVLGVGVAVVGLVRRDDGVVRMAPNLGWREVPLAQLLDQKLALGVPVHVGNEADLGGLAEHVRGAAAGLPDVLYVSGEVGIGGGVISAGRPVTGWGGYAGEIGHMVVNPAGERCGCGAVGCWETEVGEGALIRRAGRPSEGPRDRIVDEIIAAASDGDAHALSAVRQVGRWTGIGLGILVNCFNPRAIVLGGLFARLHPLIEETVNEELHSRVTVALREDLDVRAGRFGMDAPLMGAAELAFEDLLARPDELPVVEPTPRHRVSQGSTRYVAHQSTGHD
jgi:predicted NBD/HSP70 family sugar kinase